MSKKNTNMAAYEQDWNDNKNFLDRLDKRFDEANISANEGDTTTWYRCLRTIYRFMHYKIEENKNKMLINGKEYEKEDNFIVSINKLFKKARVELENKKLSYNQSLRENSISNAEEILDQIDTALSDIYAKVYIRLEKESRDPNKAVEEAFQ